MYFSPAIIDRETFRIIFLNIFSGSVSEGPPKAKGGPPRSTKGLPMLTEGPPKPAKGLPMLTEGPPLSTDGPPIATEGSHSWDLICPQRASYRREWTYSGHFFFRRYLLGSY